MKHKRTGLQQCGANFGAGDGHYFEPHLAEILAHFTKLMEAYQT